MQESVDRYFDTHLSEVLRHLTRAGLLPNGFAVDRFRMIAQGYPTQNSDGESLRYMYDVLELLVQDEATDLGPDDTLAQAIDYRMVLISERLTELPPYTEQAVTGDEKRRALDFAALYGRGFGRDTLAVQLATSLTRTQFILDALAAEGLMQHTAGGWVVTEPADISLRTALTLMADADRICRQMGDFDEGTDEFGRSTVLQLDDILFQVYKLVERYLPEKRDELRAIVRINHECFDWGNSTGVDRSELLAKLS